jgi:Carbohydrate family 9 binding domain-like
MASLCTRCGLLGAAWLVVGSACGLDFDRYAPAGTSGTLEGGADALVDGPRAGDEGAGDARTPDGAVGDAVTPPEGATDAAPTACPPTAGVVAAATVPGPITVDGDLGDWGSPTLTPLTATDAALIVGPSGTCTAANATSQCLVPAGEVADFALAYDSANLYVAVRVTVPGVGGTNTTAPYLDDAVEIYLRGDAVATGDYTSIDHQYVVDWQNLLLDYGPSGADTGQANPPGVVSAVKVAPGNGGYVLEMSIALGQLGQTILAPGAMLGFDIGIDHGQGTVATRSLIAWWLAPHAAPKCTTSKCTGCTPDQPYCDTLDFGAVCASG